MRHLQPLYGALEAYARRALHQQGEVGDVLQAAVANAYRDFDLYVEGTNFRAWIFRYVNGEIRNANRRAVRAPQALATWSEVPAEPLGPIPWNDPLAEALRNDPDTVLEQCDEALAEAIRDLPPQEQAVLLLQAIGDFKYREMAEILEIPLGTVMTHLSRARLRLRQRLGDFGRRRGLIEGNEPELD